MLVIILANLLEFKWAVQGGSIPALLGAVSKVITDIVGNWVDVYNVYLTDSTDTRSFL